MDGFIIDFYPYYRGILHNLALAQVLIKFFDLSQTTSYCIAATTFIGASELLYHEGFSQKIMRYNQHYNQYNPTVIDRLLNFIFLNPISKTLFTILAGRPAGIIWGILIDPIKLHAWGKILGSATIGGLAGEEFVDQVFQIIATLYYQFTHQDITEHLPEWMLTDKTHQLVLPILKILLIVIGTIGLGILGKLQVNSADNRLLNGNNIGFPLAIVKEYELNERLPQPTTYWQGVKQRAIVIPYWFGETTYLACRYISSGCNKFATNVSNFFHYSSSQRQQVGISEQLLSNAS